MLTSYPNLLRNDRLVDKRRMGRPARLRKREHPSSPQPLRAYCSEASRPPCSLRGGRVSFVSETVNSLARSAFRGGFATHVNLSNSLPTSNRYWVYFLLTLTTALLFV